jgi:pimeloyl-ACP methyl ester carboxylesterase
VISIVMSACVLLPVLLGDFSDTLKRAEYHYTGGRYHDKLFRYRMYVPPTLQSGKQYPLVVWLHGAGDSGDDDSFHISHIDVLVDYPNQSRKGEFLLLAVRCPSNDSAWCHQQCDADSAPGDEMITVTYNVLKKVMQEYPVDKDRVYLSGVSSGGTGCWEMALRYPQLFAAVASMSSAGGDTSRAARLKDTPVWAFHNAEDKAPAPDGVKAMVAAVATAKGDVCLTLTPHIDWTHDSWTVAMTKYDLMAWMLAQRRGDLCWLPPGCRPWKWRHILAMPAAFLAIAWLAWLRAKRKCRKRQALIIVDQPTLESQVQSSDDEADFILSLPDGIEPTVKRQ